jgi:hypothetical protein
MTTSDEYRRRAGECLLFTQYVTGERAKTLLLQMAQGWQDLAVRAEQQKLSGDRRVGESEKT